MNNLTIEAIANEEAYRLDNLIFETGYTEQMITDDAFKKLYGIFENGSCRGYCYLHGDEIEMEIYRLGILEPYRRQGYGRSLLTWIYENVATQRFILEVRGKNVPAIDLYRRNGFSEYHRRPEYYEDRDTAVLMELKKKVHYER